MTTAEMTRGAVGKEVFEVTDIPAFQRAIRRTRESDLERTLAQVRANHRPGVPVCIRQYVKKESANGTLYNLRKRHGKPGEYGWDGWDFKVGPLDSFGHEGLVGLFATYTDDGES